MENTIGAFCWSEINCNPLFSFNPLTQNYSHSMNEMHAEYAQFAINWTFFKSIPLN